MPATVQEPCQTAIVSPVDFDSADQSQHRFDRNEHQHPATSDTFTKSFLPMWNRLSLDAPVIAVTWQLFVITQWVPKLDYQIQWAQTVVLFLTVWLIYAGDRLLDVRELDFRCEVAQRHRFARQWARVLWPIWLVLFCCDFFVAIEFLDRSIWIAGMAVGSAVMLYAYLVHRGQQRAVPKELIVGCIFAAGVCLPLFRQAPDASAIVTVLLLSALFVLNCLCVAAAQQRVDRVQGVGSAIQIFPQLKFWMRPFGYLLSVLSIAAITTGLVPSLIGAAVAVCALGLSRISWRIVVSGRNAGETSASGYLADVVLLTPIVFVAVQWMPFF